jgi:hypothetical protein
VAIPSGGYIRYSVGVVMYLRRSGCTRSGRRVLPFEASAFGLRVGEVEVIVADLADVIRSKESAGRPKDLRVLPLLYRHQSTLRGGGG